MLSCRLSDFQIDQVCSVYEMAFFTYAIAFAHFSSEVFIYRTASINAGTIGPFIISSESLMTLRHIPLIFP
jgi:hypothetical protein